MRYAPQLFLMVMAIALGASLSAQSVPEIRYEANADVVSLPSDGEVAGVATNSQGHIFVYARTGYPVATLGGERTFRHGGSRLFEFDRNGVFVREIGQETYAMSFAQQVRVDSSDNVWVVDASSNMLMKFDPSGRLLMVMGRKPESMDVRPGGWPARLIDGEPPAAPPAEGAGAGASPRGAGLPAQVFSRPSDVTWDQAGNIYVADGYGNNNRIAKFAPDATFLKSWGHTGSGRGEFNRIRGIASDAAGNIYVADAGNKRIQVFDREGAFKSEITNVGTPQAICISGGSVQYLYSSNSNDPESMDNGEIYKLRLNGQIVGKFGRAREGPGGVRHGQCSRLPLRERAVGGRDLELARPEGDAITGLLGTIGAIKLRAVRRLRALGLPLKRPSAWL